MAQSGYTPILIYGSGTPGNTPSAGNLTSSSAGAELAINYADGKLYYKDSGGAVQVIATKGAGTIGGSNTQVQFNNSGALAGSANLTFDGTKLTAAGLNVSGLTASTALALDASKNVVSVTNTGTGNNVLATSPVLTTPNLGTPSALTLTNATGLPIAGITGLGTGVGTALAVNVGSAGAVVLNGGALGTPSSGTVTNLTGTASININGTVGATTPTTGAFTTVAASAVDGFRNTSAFAAIRLLQTAGGVGYRWALANDGNFYMQRTADGFATAASTPMFVGSNDRIGIGTTSPDALLTVAGVAAFGAGTAAAPALTTIGDLDTGVWFPAANTWAVATGASERMRITSGGDVGIGMTPGTKLDVQGDITARGASISSAAYINMGTAYTAAYLEWVPGSSQLTIMNSQAGPLRFATNNGERMRITSGGDVGIGTTNPLQPLHVIGSARFQGNIFNVNGFATVDLLESATGVGFRWALNNNGTFRLQRSANGTYSDATTPILFDSSSRTIIGGTTAIGGTASVWNGLYLGANDSTAEFQNYRASDNSGAAFQYLNKARGTIASPTVVQNGDGLGSQIWRGYDGASYVQAAIIRAEVDGTPGSGDMPGRLVFATTLDGASTATERMRIKSAGQVRFVPLAADPAGAESGDVYYNSGTNKLRVYNGTTWENLH